jgi:putative FmdB family regulatory protein
MPTYGYICDKCDHEFEIDQRIADEPLVKCPECKKKALRRKFYVPIAVSTGPRTLGMQAEANARAMGRDEISERAARKQERVDKMAKAGRLPPHAKHLATKPKTPWWRTGEVEGTIKSDKPLNDKQVDEIVKQCPELKKDRTTDGKQRKRPS